MYSKPKPCAHPAPPNRWTLSLLIACSVMISSCAIFGRPSVPTAPTAPPPQLTLPTESRKSCPLYTLPANPLRVDLEIGYATRGAQVVACDAARETAVVTFDRQAEAVAEQARARERRRSWSCRWLNAGC